MHHVRGSGGVFNDPPDHKGDREPPKDGLKIHVVLPKAPGLVLLVREPMLA